MVLNSADSKKIKARYRKAGQSLRVLIKVTSVGYFVGLVALVDSRSRFLINILKWHICPAYEQGANRMGISMRRCMGRPRKIHKLSKLRSIKFDDRQSLKIAKVHYRREWEIVGRNYDQKDSDRKSQIRGKKNINDKHDTSSAAQF